MSLKKSIIILLLLIISYGSLFSSSPYNFLRVQSSARSAGLAGSFVSMADDPSAVSFNPASIYTVESKYTSATFLKHVLDINSGQINYIHPTEDDGVFGASVNYISYGSFVRTDQFANEIGDFGANNLSISFSYSNELDTGLYWGASAKLIYANIESESSIAAAIDAGLFYRLRDGRTNFGVSILNAGTQLSKFAGQNESLPLDIRIGANHRLRGLPLLVNASFNHLADDVDSFFDRFQGLSIGGELYLGKYIMFRLGYDNKIRQMTSIETNKKFSGFSGGVGINTNDLNIDYSMSFYGSGATLHRFTVGFDFLQLINQR